MIYVKKMIEFNNNNNYIKPLLLARYGIVGKEAIFIRRLKYKNIDIENKVINVENENGIIIRKLPIDDRFIKLLFKLTDKEIKSDQNDILKSDGYFFKSSTSNEKIVNYHTMNAGINNVCNSIKEDRISLGNLLFTRQIEVLLNMRKKGKLTNDDIRMVIREFGDDESVDKGIVTILKKNYELLIQDTVIDKRNNIDNFDNFDSKEFTEMKAKEFGVDINDYLSITKYRNNNIIDVEDSKYQDDIYNAFVNSNNDNSNFEFKKIEKKKLSSIKNIVIYPRDSRVGLNALKLANYECALNKEHETFVSNTTSRNYVEAHHLIPIKYYHSEEFKSSIDNEANIIALCPNCHRLLHYGQPEEKVKLLKILYNERKEYLQKVGILIKFDRLVAMYIECSKR